MRQLVTSGVGVLCAIASLLTAPIEPTLAITISIIGGEGAPGADGAHQPSGADGEFGGDGGDIVSGASVHGDGVNTAAAVGGKGGRGGDGGFATDPAGSGGHGGEGGDGGTASADAQTFTDRLLAIAASIAEGGDGGDGGEGGDGGVFGTAGRGADGGQGGNAHARAFVESQRAGAPANSSATAIGGQGGDGGAGGSSLQSVGGNGGDGGGATLSPVVGRAQGGDLQLRARAVGGAGGDGKGSYGSGGGGASVNINNVVHGTTTGSMILSQEAVGGHGGDAEGGFAGHAGSATNSLFIVDREAASIEADVKAFGGRGGDDSHREGREGATARADAAITGDGPVTLRLEASGGRGGDGGATGNGQGGDGATAQGSVRAESTGDDHVAATALLYGGDGGNGARGGDGADMRAFTAVSGDTSGSLQLIQSATGGDAGAGLAGAAGSAGDASSSINISEDGPRSIVISSQAFGGWGASGLFVPQAATANSGVIASSSTATQMSLIAAAIGGGGGSITGVEDFQQAAHGGAAQINEVRAVSTAPSAAIDATADVVGGHGGDNAGMGNAGNGASASLFNRVDGNAGPSSMLGLAQFVRGGDGGNARLGAAGQGGDAVARLNHTNDVEHLSLQQTANGGAGGNRDHEFGSAGAGGDADVDTSAVNTRSTLAAAVATGGHGGGGAGGSRGGNAYARAYGQNATAETVRAYAEATSGNGGAADSDNGPGGIPGLAHADAYGESTGGATVDVAARQIGGDGGGALSREGAHGASSFIFDRAGGSTSGLLKLQQESRGGNGGDSSYRAGRGGTAVSRLQAQNPGGGPIEGTVLAFGGDGGNAAGTMSPGEGGLAEASIHLNSDAGAVLAVSEAAAGRAGANDAGTSTASPGHASSQAVAETGAGFRAEARSNVSAARGMTGATSITSGGAIDFTRFHAGTSHAVPEGSDFIFSRTNSVVSQGGFHSGTTTGYTALSHGSIMPAASAVASHLLGDPTVASAYGGEGVSTALSLVTMGFNPANGTSLSRSASAEFDFDLVDFAQGRLIIGLLDPVSSSPTAPISLQLNILRDGELVVDQAFSSLAEVLSYFNDRVLDLGLMTPGDNDAPDLSISLDMTSPDVDAQFGVTMFVASVGGDPASFEADFDEDGDVDSRDLIEWQDGFGTNGASGSLSGDADSDGDVDGHDFLTWQRQVGGSTASSPATTSAVAEPACLSLALVGIAPVLGCRRRRWNHYGRRIS